MKKASKNTIKIDKLRRQLYKAIDQKDDYATICLLSQELDMLLLDAFYQKNRHIIKKQCFQQMSFFESNVG